MRFAYALLAMLGVVGVAAAQDGSREAEGGRWTALSPPVFRLVASSRGMGEVPFTESPFSLAQDITGFIWVGTQSGLERWDGHQFRTYSAHPDDPCALPADDIETLHVDAQGRFWVGTGEAGLFRYDPQTDCFHGIKVGAGGLASGYVKSLADDGAGGLWVGTTAGLDHLAPDLLQVTHVAIGSGTDRAGGAQSVLRVLPDTRGALWLATENALLRRGPGAADFSEITLPSNGRPPSPVRALLQASDGRLWVGTGAGAAYVIDPKTLAGRQVAALAQLNPAAPMWDAAEAPGGEIWFATHGTGIVAVDPVSLRVRVLRHEKGVPTSLLDDAVEEVFRDRRGLMWIACEKGFGFYKVDAAVATILTVDAANGLPDGTVSALARLADDRIAVGSRHEIVSMGPQSAGAAPIPFDTPLPPDGVYALATPDGRDLFAGIRPLGLLRIDQATRRSHPVPLPGPHAVPRVFSLAAEGEHVWVGGLDRVWELARPPGVGGASGDWAVTRQFEVPSVFAIVGAGATHWFGSKAGLFRVAGAAAAAEHLALVGADGAPIADPFFLTLLVDRRQHLWAGTTGRGLFVLDPSTARDGRIRVLRQMTGELPSSSIDALLEDGAGQVWVSTDRGIARIDPGSFTVRRLGRSDGVVVSDYWAGSAVATSQGELIFGAESGMTIIRPDRIDAELRPPTVVVTGISVGDRHVPSALFNQAGADRVLEVPADAQSVSVDFVALDFTDPEQYGYAYKLDGYDRDWARSGFDDRMVRYTNLSPGMYRLRLRATDGMGMALGGERQVLVRVAAAWYQTMWFHALEAFALLLTLVLIVQARTVLLRARQRELESLVEERTQALVRATGERNSLIENLAHDLRTPLTSLRGYLDRLSLNEETLTDADRSRFVAIAVRQAERLIRLVRELFELVRLDDPLATLTLERFTPAEIVQDVVQEFASIAEGRSIACELEPGVETVQILGDISLFQRLIDNLVDNAVSHTPAAGKVTVRLAADDASIVLEVSDTGRGIERADIGRIFDRYERGDTTGRVSGAGLGLAIVKRILELHDGGIEVDSDVGRGARFTVRLPRTGPKAQPGGTSL